MNNKPACLWSFILYFFSMNRRRRYHPTPDTSPSTDNYPRLVQTTLLLSVIVCICSFLFISNVIYYIGKSTVNSFKVCVSFQHFRNKHVFTIIHVLENVPTFKTVASTMSCVTSQHQLKQIFICLPTINDPRI